MQTKLGYALTPVAWVLTVSGAFAMALRELSDSQASATSLRAKPWRLLFYATIAIASAWTAFWLALPIVRTALGARKRRPATQHTRRSIVGQRLPTIVGRALSGAELTLPRDVAGKVALLAVGFSYGSRFDVEAWAGAFRDRFGARSDIALFEIPALNRLARCVAPLIASGMRAGTPIEHHREVVVVYEAVSALRSALGANGDADTWIYLLGRGGHVLFQCSGNWDEMLFRQLATTAESAIAAETHRGHPGAYGAAVASQ